ncbi:MAG: hypothetical protein LAN70_01330 [Acidobacteriia bacterium]|nr:hypothetical protein [Terriglobia bacterium]
MFEKFLQLLSMTCRHKHTSQPFAAVSVNSIAPRSEWEPMGARTGHYIVCLDCGKRIPYDWANMRRIG